MSAEEQRRRRVGLLVPSSNSVMEVDFYRRFPAHVTLHTGRMFMERTTPEGESEMLDEHTIPAARAVGTALPHVVVFGCTSAGALRGNDYDRQLCERISEVTGAHVVSVIQAVQRAVETHGAPRVGIVTPYVEALNREIRSSLEAATSAEVVAIHGLGIDENFAIASVPPEDITAFAKERLGGLDLDLVFVSCTNFRAMDAIAPLETAFGVPVVTSNQAALAAVWDALERVDEPPQVTPTAAGRRA
jgi:maleate isomerase